MTESNKTIAMKVLHSSPNKIICVWENSNPSIAHSLKRIMESETPKMAIHIVNMIDNTSVLPDEMIVQRLGIIPLKNDCIDNYLFNNECECETSECHRCSVCINMSIVCTDSQCNVTSRDLSSNDPNVYPIHDSGIPAELCTGKNTEGILIAKLKKNQKIILNCVAKKGVGATHAKFSSTVALAVRTVPHEKVDTVLYPMVKKGKKFCEHELLFDPRNGHLDITPLDCDECEEDDKIDFNNVCSLFVVESDGSIPSSMILSKSVKTLKAKVYKMLNELQ